MNSDSSCRVQLGVVISTLHPHAEEVRLGSVPAVKPAAALAASLRLIGALLLRPTEFHSGSSGAEAPAALAMSRRRDCAIVY